MSKRFQERNKPSPNAWMRPTALRTNLATTIELLVQDQRYSRVRFGPSELHAHGKTWLDRARSQQSVALRRLVCRQSGEAREIRLTRSSKLRSTLRNCPKLPPDYDTWSHRGFERSMIKGARIIRAIKNGVPHLNRFGPVKVFNVARSAMRAPPTCGTAFLITILAVPGKYACERFERVTNSTSEIHAKLSSGAPIIAPYQHDINLTLFSLPPRH
ncbi:Hypothetical predicted protein [Olea europaea subsp. europaea]|uniref:Uncharacterized protein n=1 Tax=Olea europaea subsp. europaea TaxID=158383 RepID=A0A8S0TNS4_OLEEU|nr:Hypothetical predicted protein [Olea europaea subsp. europaea]